MTVVEGKECFLSVVKEKVFAGDTVEKTGRGIWRIQEQKEKEID